MSGFTNKYGDVCPPSGSIIIFAGTKGPSGWLLCDGASYSTQTYSSLYGVIGNTYGGSSGTFNVPDLRSKFVRGAAATNTITNTTVGADSITIALTVDNIPALTVPTLSIPSLSFAGVSVPSLSVPSLSFAGVSIPGLSVPQLSVPQLYIPSLSVSDHTHNYNDAFFCARNNDQSANSSTIIGIGQSYNFDSKNAVTYRTQDGLGWEWYPIDIPTTGFSGASTGASYTGGGATGTGTTGVGTTSGGVTDLGFSTGTGTTGGGVTDSGFSTGTGTTGGSGASFNVATVPNSLPMNYIIKM